MSTGSDLKTAMDSAFGSVPPALDTARGQLATAIGASTDAVAAATLSAAAAATATAIAAIPTPKQFLTGTGVPSGGLGANGDVYLDEATDILYGPKSGGAWGSGSYLSGNTIYNGSGAPSGGLGRDGDWYFNSTGHTVYGPKTSGSWGSPFNLVGAGVPAGGTAGQILVKNSSTDYDFSAANPQWWMQSKPADQTVNGSGLTDDTDLQTAALVSGSKYRIKARIFFASDGTHGFKYGFSGPTITRLRVRRVSLAPGDTSSSEAILTAASYPSASLTEVGGGTAGMLELDMLLTPSSAAALVFRFACVSSTVDVTVLAGSTLEWSLA